MRGKGCSAEFMRRLERMVAAANGKTKKELVQAICHQTCLNQVQVYQLLRVLQLEDQLSKEKVQLPEKPQPTILIEALSAPDPVGLVKNAIDHGWTASQVRLQAAKLRVQAQNDGKPIGLPDGRYRTIVVDPPWAYQNTSGRQRQDYAERTMGLETIGRFDIERWVPLTGGCHLYLWVTDAYAGDIYQVLRAWKFDPKTWLVWMKDRIGMGNYFRHQHEFCVFAVRGKLRLSRLDASTVFRARVTRHSEKPDAFYSLVESCSPGPYLDVFARRKRAGWDVYGDEVNAATAYQTRMDGPNTSRKVD